MGSPHLDLLTALQVIAKGGRVPPGKFGALVRNGLIRLRGHGAREVPLITSAGHTLLETAARPTSKNRAPGHDRAQPAPLR